MTLNMNEVMREFRKRLPEMKDISTNGCELAGFGDEYIDCLLNLDLDSFTEHISEESRGAIPVLEGDENACDWRLIRKGPESFKNMVEAREWASTILEERSVAAVDGSQVYPGNDLSIPVGLVNVAWYINHHNGEYEIDRKVSLLLPDDLGFNPDSGIDTRRQEQELARVSEIVQELGKDEVVFLDGSLVLSFILHIFENYRNIYITSILDLLDITFHDKETLLAAYIDNSRATDLAVMLSGPGKRKDHDEKKTLLDFLPATSPFSNSSQNFISTQDTNSSDNSKSIQYTTSSQNSNSIPNTTSSDISNSIPYTTSSEIPTSIPNTNTTENGIEQMIRLPQDAQFLDPWMSWGDRTSAFICARKDTMKLYMTKKRDHSTNIAFFYIKTSIGRIARVEFPAWIVKFGKVDLLADVVRAQAIIGDGYPHVLNRAHQEAVVSTSEKEMFLGMLQRFSAKYDLGISASLKAIKKRK